MHLTLLVPGLLWPREILRDITFDLPLPALSLLLGRGRRSTLPDDDTWLADAFGLEAPLPAAALRLLASGGDPGQDDWLCLDPIHLRLEERAVIIDDPTALALSCDEDLALRDAVAPLFEPIGTIVAPTPGQWHLRVTCPTAIVTRPLPQAAGLPADPALPGGADGPAWRRLLAEAQLLLHTHPVNRSREESGHSTVNSLWPWGDGRLPTAARRGFDKLWSDDATLKGLGALTGAGCESPPAGFVFASGRIVSRLNHLSSARATLDAMAWHDAMRTLESTWLAPALAGLRRGRVRSLRLIVNGDGDGQAWSITTTHRDLWRFWRPSLALTELAP
jgi:hypothetical protein